MSQLKKALQKARQEGKANFDFSVEQIQEIQESPEDWVKENRIDRKSDPGKNGMDVPPPTYHQTKCVELNQELLSENKVVSALPEHEIGDQFKLLRTMVLNRMRPSGHTTIEITSFGEGEGKTYVSVNLAITLAKDSRQNVLLIDMDMRRPSVHTILGLNPKPGLRDYFVDNVALSEILIHPNIERLTVIPAGGRMDNSTEVLGSRRMETLIRELKNRYEDRYILFDTPALNTCSDPLVLSSHLDAMLLVARSGKTTTESITSGMSLLKDKNVLGVVLNNSNSRSRQLY